MIEPTPAGLVVPYNAQSLARAAEQLLAGRLVAFPTETVYGLGADATNSHAVARIFAAKGRPRFNPLIVHLSGLADAVQLAAFDAAARALAATFWPGPLTLVLPALPNSGIADLATAGLDSIAIRVPSHPVARALLAATGRPVAAPSANRSGHVSATTAAHVAADLGTAVTMILDDGPATHGLESSIVDCTSPQPVLLRSGAISRDRIEAVLGQRLRDPMANTDAQPLAPGRLASHYAPNLPIRLDAVAVQAGEALLAFGPAPLPCNGPFSNLSVTGDLVEAAARLFAALRELDASGATGIAAMAIPAHGLGEAIRDRLTRAAAPRT